MTRNALALTLGLALLPVAAGAQTRDYADVIRAEPIVERYTEPREICRDRVDTVVERDRGDATAGTIVGALIGGAVGNQVGGGDGRRAATVAGAVAGGAIGRNIDRNNDRPRYREREVVSTRCRTVEEYSERTVAWDVTYRYAGRTYSARLDHDPGRRLPVFVDVQPAG